MLLSACTPTAVFVLTALLPRPTLIGSLLVPRISMSAFSELTVPLSVMLSDIVDPTVRSSLTCKFWLIVVVPPVAPIVMMLAAPNAVTLVTVALSKVNPDDVVLSDVKIVGESWNTRRLVPVVSVTKPRICVDVVDANDARVSEVYATFPPCLKFILIDAVLLSDVRSKSLSISSFLPVAISNSPDAVDAIINPLIDVAVADPNIGAVSTGEVRVLFVNTCDSPSVTNLFSTEPVSYTHLTLPTIYSV